MARPEPKICSQKCGKGVVAAFASIETFTGMDVCAETAAVNARPPIATADQIVLRKAHISIFLCRIALMQNNKLQNRKRRVIAAGTNRVLLLSSPTPVHSE